MGPGYGPGLGGAAVGGGTTVGGGGKAGDGCVGGRDGAGPPPGISTRVSHRVSADPVSGVSAVTGASGAADSPAPSPASGNRVPHPAQKGDVPVRARPHVAQKLMPACLFQSADG